MSHEPDPLDAEEPSASYFKYEPQDAADGLAHNVHVGEIVPGRTYEVRAHLAPLFRDDPQWKRSSRKEFEKQPSLEEDKQRFQVPADAGPANADEEE